MARVPEPPWASPRDAGALDLLGLPGAAGAGPCLRRLPGRAVWREGALWVKGFAAASAGAGPRAGGPRIGGPGARALGAVGALRAQMRARREHRALVQLGARGLAVPRAHGLERRRGPDGHVWWCVLAEWLEDARDLQRWGADGGHPAPGLAAARLGRLVAELAHAGASLADLHPGNLLLDPAARAWACDLRLGRTAGLREERALARLGGRLLARTRPLERARFGLAYLARRTELGAAPPAERGAWLAALEARLPGARAADVERDLDRWLRPSGRLAPSPDGRWLVARGRADASELLAHEAAPDGPTPHVCIEGTPSEVRRAWLAQARAFELGQSPLSPVAIERRALCGSWGRTWRRRGGARAWLSAPTERYSSG